MRRVVITGGLGYIGAALIARTQRHADRHVLVIDNRFAQRCSADFPRVDLIEEDIRTATLDPLIVRADAVVHLAALADPAQSVTCADMFEQVNVEGTRRVAETCARAGVPLLFASTTGVYGTPKRAISEDCASADLRPQTPYAASKLAGERVLKALGTGGLRYAVLRFGSVFGPSPGMRLDTAVNRFCCQAFLGQPVAVWRTALHQRRPYLHIDDAVRAICFVLRKHLFDNRVYNVVTVNATVYDVLRAIGSEVGALMVQYVDSPLMNELSYAVIADRIRRQGFTPRGDLRHGIRQTLDVLQRARAAAA